MKQLTGQLLYMGPRIHHLGLGYGAIFRDGIHKSLYSVIEECPSIAELFIPVADVGQVRRELNFDYSHNMRGTIGRHVTFYREVQKWIASATNKKPSTGVQINHAKPRTF